MKALFRCAILGVALTIASAAGAQAQDEVGTLLHAAQAAERIGNVVLARDLYERAVALASAVGDERTGVARERFAAIDARVPKLTVRLLVGAPGGVTVKRDGVVVPTATLGVPVPVTAGRHEVVVEALERSPRTFVVTLAEGERKLLDVSPGAGAFRANGAGPNAALGDDEDSQHTEDFSQRTVGISLGSAGLAALGLGAMFGITALSASGDDARDRDAARVSTGFLLGGAIAVVAGAIVFFTAPSSR